MTRAVFKRRLKQVAIVVGIAVGIAAVLVVLMTVGVWVAETFLKSSGKRPTSADQLNHWIRIFAGKWQPDEVYGRTSFLYAFSAGVALLLNLVVIGGLVSLIIGWVRKVRPLLLILDMENVMTNEQVIHFLAARQMAEINKRFPDRKTMETIKECFTVGEQNWLKELPGVVGPRRARRISDAMKQRSFDPEP